MPKKYKAKKVLRKKAKKIPRKNLEVMQTQYKNWPEEPLASVEWFPK